MEHLRFAPIIRVSTEKQEQKGESLADQKSHIIDYVKFLHGSIPESCWEYSGQEHATPGQERAKFDKLLKDSGKDIFDAVMVTTPDRWSRDPLKSAESLNILKANGIRFFIGTMETDLYNPQHNLIFEVNMVFGKFQAHQQALKSITSQIHRARRGIPTPGSLPYGRTFDKKLEENGWAVDPLKKAIIEQAAERYLSGKENLKAIATSLGFKSSSNLRKILTDRCGTEWTVSFRNDEVNVNEIVTIPIPELLDASTILAIHEKTKASKTYQRPKLKREYLINRMIFCSTCGQPLSGSTSNDGKNRYYKHPTHIYHKHPKKSKQDPNFIPEVLPCRFTKYVHGNEIENVVLMQLMLMFGDEIRIQKAVADAHPDIAKVEGLKREQEDWANQLKKITAQRVKILEKISYELITDDEARPLLKEFREREAFINSRLSIIASTLASIPDPDKVKKVSKFAGAVLSNIRRNEGESYSPRFILTKPFQYQRQIVENAFGGRDVQGNPLGVYMTETGEGWSFEIRGLFGNSLLSLPLTDDYLEDVFRLDPEYIDFKEILKNRGTKTPQERGRG